MKTISILSVFLMFSLLSFGASHKAKASHNPTKLKSASASFLLDSLVENSESGKIKTIFFYDTKSLDTLWITFGYDTIKNKYVFSTKDRYYKNSNGLDTMILTHSYDTTINAWKPAYKEVHQFDNRNNDTTVIYYNWDSDKWSAYSKETYAFDASDHDTLYTVFQSDPIEEWSPFSKRRYYYDANGKDTATYYYRNMNTWIYKGKDILVYDAKGNNTSIEHYSLTDKVNKTVYNYNTSSLDTLNIFYNWDPTNSVWLNANKYKSTWSVSGQKLTDTSFMWVNADWNIISISSYYYKKTIALSTSTLTFPNSASNSDINITSNVSWTINSDQNWLTVNISSGSNSKIINLSVTANTNTSIRSATVTISSDGISQNITVNQEGRSLGIKTAEERRFTYPNPVEENIHLNSSFISYSIVDLTGKIVKSGNIKNDDNIEVSELKKGVFILSLSTKEGKSFTQKFIKK